MAYENKIAIESCIKRVHEQQGTLEKTQLIINEIEEVYHKAKYFDEIMKIDNQATDEDRVTGEYESDIETVLSEYKERADDER